MSLQLNMLKIWPEAVLLKFWPEAVQLTALKAGILIPAPKLVRLRLTIELPANSSHISAGTK